ncbi:hypothetical protein V1264_010357 [Littorina saxatilis]|uniref:Transmembrane 9 superfamily member n=2 Tax=Littorina saxatilis TaxID=31220 RepID=A0AAN9APB0_9CAEN
MEFGVPRYKRKVCEQTLASEEEVEFLKKAIDGEFKHNLFMDDLPVRWCYQTQSEFLYCSAGLPVGCYINGDGERQGFCLSPKFSEPDTYYIYNHFVFTVHYEPVVKLTTNRTSNAPATAGKIIQVTVTPRSEKRGDLLEPVKIPAKRFGKRDVTISFTFDVVWKESDIRWSERWGLILLDKNTNILFFSVMNTGIIALFVCAMVLLVLLRTHPRFHKLHLRLKACNDRFTLRQSWRIDEDAWKALDRDVFRPPENAVMLAALCGNAAQIFCTILAVLVGGSVGILVPANPGLLVKWTMWGYGVSGLAAGFVSRHIFQNIGKRSKGDGKCCAVLSVYYRSWLISGLLFSIFLGLNLIHWEEGSSSALDVWSLSRVFLLMVCLPVPCTLVGGWLSFALTTLVNQRGEHLKNADESPPPPIPKQPRYMWAGVLVLIEGILPFSAIFIPAFFCLSSVWFVQYFHASGCLMVVLFATIVIAVCISCYACFLQLCNQNYKWWWKPMLAGVGLSVYYFLYTIYFFVQKLEMTGWASTALFFGYNFIVATVLFLLTGPMCFMGTYLFVERIYYYLSLTSSQEENVVVDTENTANQDEDDSKELLREGSDLSSLSKDGWDTLQDSTQLTGQRL